MYMAVNDANMFIMAVIQNDINMAEHVDYIRNLKLWCKELNSTLVGLAGIQFLSYNEIVYLDPVNDQGNGWLAFSDETT